MKEFDQGLTHKIWLVDAKAEGSFIYMLSSTGGSSISKLEIGNLERSENYGRTTPFIFTGISQDDDRSPPADLRGAESSNKTRNCCGVGSVSGSTGPISMEFQAPCPDQVLENVLENVLQFLSSRRDRNAASLVCKSWWRVEALTRSDLYIGNCYSVSPRRAMSRFSRVQSVSIKGRPRFADFNLMPIDWGAHFTPWVTAMASAYPWLEKVYLKRMSVTDDDLALLAESFPSFKELVIVCCDGFSTSGLAIVASDCRQLKVLDLIESEVTDDDVDWIACFPESGATCLESLIFDCVECSINFDALESLVVRSPSLKKGQLFLNPKVNFWYKGDPNI